MHRDLKEIFYSNLLTIILVISNFVGIKYTNYHDLILSINFITMPFAFLCFLLIRYMYGKKESVNIIISCLLIQVVIFSAYFIINNFSSFFLNLNYVYLLNEFFKTSILYIIINLMAFIISIFTLNYIYQYFRIINYRFLGAIIAFLLSFILYSVIMILIFNSNLQFDLIIHLILCHTIISIIMAILITCLFYILKEREYPYKEEKNFFENIYIKFIKNIKNNVKSKVK